MKTRRILNHLAFHTDTARLSCTHVCKYPSTETVFGCEEVKHLEVRSNVLKSCKLEPGTKKEIVDEGINIFKEQKENQRWSNFNPKHSLQKSMRGSLGSTNPPAIMLNVKLLGAYYRHILTLKSYLIYLVTMVISVRTTFRKKAFTEQHFLYYR